MENTILSGMLLISTFLTPTPTPTPIISPVEILVAKKEYEVKEGDSLSSIAEKEYGSKEYWTLIWNDNPSISNPNVIEKSMKLTLSTTKPPKAPELKTALKEKLSQAPRKEILSINTSGSPKSLNEAQINFLGQCESGMTANRNSGNGYYGAFQFSVSTWNNMNTGYERADLAPIEVQIDAVQRLLQRSSIFTQFPGCARKMQSQGLI